MKLRWMTPLLVALHLSSVRCSFADDLEGANFFSVEGGL